MDTIRAMSHISGRLAGAPRTGIVVEVGESGIPIVEYSGNGGGPIPARAIIQSASAGDLVLLVFDEGDPAKPIIIGIVRDRFERSDTRRLKLAAKEVVLEGTEQVSLRCGDSSLTLRRDGKTLLKGKEVLSRASRANRIKGAIVQIN